MMKTDLAVGRQLASVLPSEVLMIILSLLLILVSPLEAAPGGPLLDLTVQGYGGLGLPLSRGSGADLLARAGGAFTGWISPHVGLGIRADSGTYGVFDDEGNIFLFAEGRYRPPAGPFALGLGVGTPLVWVEYQCEGNSCVEGPWEYHDPIFTASATWERHLSRLHLPLSLRVEASKVRLGLGLDVGIGWRFRRR